MHDGSLQTNASDMVISPGLRAAALQAVLRYVAWLVPNFKDKGGNRRRTTLTFASALTAFEMSKKTSFMPINARFLMGFLNPPFFALAR